MRTVHVGVSHQNDFVVTQFARIEIFFTNAGAERGDQRLDLAVAEHLVKARLFHVQNLALKGEDGLVLTIAALLG